MKIIVWKVDLNHTSVGGKEPTQPPPPVFFPFSLLVKNFGKLESLMKIPGSAPEMYYSFVFLN